MSSLLAQSELRAGLPQFVGATLAEQLLNGRTEAAARLGKYVTKLTYSPPAAADLLHEIKAWQERNYQLLDEYMQNPATDTLPEQVALEFGPEKAQALIVAGYSEAARGLGPWLSGDLQANMGIDATIPEPWVREDAKHRLQVFGSIVKMDDDGDLDKIFRPEQASPAATSGLGALPAVVAAVGAKWLIVALILTFLATVALFLVYTYSMERLRLNNKIMADRCAAAEARGDTETVRLCIESAAGLQDKGPFDDLLDKVLQAAALAGGVYLVITVGVPALGKALGQASKGARGAKASG